MPNFKNEMVRLTEAQKTIAALKQKISDTPTKDIDALIEAQTELQIVSFESKFIVENAKYCFFNEYMPKVKEILARYNGKSYGPKTKEAIYSAIKTELNVGFWIEQNEYHSSINIYPLDDRGFTDHSFKGVTAYTHRESEFILTPGNKINVDAFPFTSINIAKEYIEDTRCAALEVLKRIEKVKAAEKELNSAISELNNMMPYDIDHISASYIRYPRF